MCIICVIIRNVLRISCPTLFSPRAELGTVQDTFGHTLQTMKVYWNIGID